MEPNESRRARAAARRAEARSARGPRVIVAVVVVLLVACLALGGLVLIGSSHSPAPTEPTVAAATATPHATAAVSVTPSGTASPDSSSSPTPTSTPNPAPQLPSLLAAIGDSYSQAYSVSPSYLRDHTQFSWVVGTARGDGVFSLYERFRALGAAPTVVDAATSGRKMDDAPRQAGLVVAAAKKLKAGQTAYVTFELGTNDLCDDPKTDRLDFDVSLGAAVAALKKGLPAGSRILILPVPDFAHFHDITQADPTARAAYTTWSFSNRCAPFLGTNSPTSMSDAQAILAYYEASLLAACTDINSTQGIRCTYDAKVTADSDFVIGDLSKVDYFHPSLTGQAKLAQDAWSADVWAGLPLPANAEQ